MRSIYRSLFLLAACQPALAQSLPGPAQLLADVGSETLPSTAVSDFVRVGAWSYFVARVDETQRLYRTGGSSLTSEAFFDVDPSQPQLISSPTAVGSRLFFFAGPETTRMALWCSDGTRAGTRPLTDSASLPLSVQWARGANGVLVFLANASDGFGMEPWISDGTVAGTQRLADLTPGSNGTVGRSESVGVVPDASGTGERVWFSSWEFLAPGQSRTSFWSTDGTLVGTQREALIDDFRVLGFPTVFGPGRVAFTAGPGGGGGIDQVLVLEQGQGVVEFAAPRTLSRHELGVGFDGRAVFGAHIGNPLAFAATSSGVRPIGLRGGVKNGPSLPLGSRAGVLLIAYLASNRSWRLASLPMGSDVADDIGPLPGEPVSVGTQLFQASHFIGDRLVLVAWAAGGRSVFGIDWLPGAPFSTVELYRGGGVAFAGQHFGQVLFQAVRSGRHSLWASDGSVSGTGEIDNLLGSRIDPDSNLREFTPFGERIAFLGGSLAIGLNPWITDGTPSGTMQLADLRLSRSNAGIRDMLVVGDEIWSVRSDPVQPLDLLIEAWDGRFETSREIAHVRPTASGGVFSRAVAFGDSLLIFASGQSAGGLLRIDGDGSIHPVLVGDRTLERIEVLGNQALIFNHRFFNEPRQVYLTDGTEQGTQLLGEVGNYQRESISVARFADRVWVSVADGTFVIDASGVTPFPSVPALSRLLAAGDQLFAHRASELSVTDGTPSGTVELLRGVPLSGGRLLPAVMGDRLLFVSGVGAQARPWVSDGTSAGTMQLADIPVGQTEFWVTGPNRCLFPGTDPATGMRSLCVTGGLPSNTSILQPLAIPDEPIELGIAHAGRVMVLVDDPQFGREPYTIDARFGVETRGLPCAAQGFAMPTLRVNDSPVLGATVELRAQRAGATLGWFLLGAPRSRPAVLAGTRCPTELDLLSAVVSTGQMAGPGGLITMTLPLPNVPALVGLRVAAQSVFAAGTASPGFELTETVVLGLGQ